MARYGVTDLKPRPSNSTRSPASRSSCVPPGTAWTTRTSASSRCFADALDGEVEDPLGEDDVTAPVVVSVRSQADANTASVRMKTRGKRRFMAHHARGRGGSVMPG